MKIFIVLAFLLFATNPPQKPDGKGKQSNDQADSRTESPIVVVNNNSTQAEAPNGKKKAPEWDVSVWANWALVAVGIITFIAVWKQARETAKATQAMRDGLPLQRDAAKAALLNARAVINAERPWVTFFAVKTEPTAYSFRAGNVGRSPAKIVAYWHDTFYEHPSNLKDDLPSYGIAHDSRIDFLMPSPALGGQDIEICTNDPGFVMFGDIRRKDRLMDRKEAIIVILKIAYQNVGNPDPETNMHETRMCFAWTPGADFGVSGPRTWNQHT